MSFISDFRDYVIATEADDITKDVSSQTDDVMGNTGDDKEDNGEIDTNTDDILGTQSDDNPDDGDSGEGEDNPDDSDNSDDMGDGDSDDSEGGDDMGMDGGDTPSDDSNPDDQPQDENDPFTESRKKKIKKQFMHLYNVIDDSVKLISTYNPNVVDTKYIHVLSSIKDNLTQCKEIIYNLAVNEFQNMEYHELLKKYVAINRIYEISTKTLEKYFEEYRKEQGTSGKRNA